MKSILFVYHASNIGGGTYCLLNILKEIDRNKYQPIVLLRTNGDLVREIKALSIEVRYMPEMTLVPYNHPMTRKVRKTYQRIAASMPAFERVLDEVKPDAVYLNTMMLAPYLETVKKKGCRTVIHLREHWPLDENVEQLNNLQWIITNYADEIIAINGYSASMMPEREATIVYDWIDMSKRYEPSPFDEIFHEDASKLKVFLFTGGLQDIKGAAEVVDTFKKHIIGSDKRLLMVGVELHPNYKGLKNKVRLLLSKVGYNVYEYKVRKKIASDSRIVCIPATYAMKHIMEQAYCNLSCFTIPHANLAMAESIILGTVPVAAKTVESIEYSCGGEMAVLFKLGDERDMLTKLRWLNGHYDEMKERIARDGHKVAELFDTKRNVAVLHSVLERLFKN